MEFQIIYEANIDFEATRENLSQLGYEPCKERVGRKPMDEAGVLTFQLHENSVNISPKGEYHAIQVHWKSFKEMKENHLKLLDLLKSKDTWTFRKRLAIINLSIPYDEEFLKNLDVAHSECWKKYNSEEMAKLRKLVELFR